MGHYETAFKTNIFEVKNGAAFEKECERYGITINLDYMKMVDKNKYQIYNFDFIPTRPVLEEEDDDTIPDFIEMVGNHLKDGSVAIFYQSGNMKLAEVYGTAIAVNSESKIVSISLEDIETIAMTIGYIPKNPEPEDLYVYSDNGNKCPYCGSDRLNTHKPVMEDGKILMKVECRDCKGKMVDTYSLTSVELEEGKKKWVTL